MNLSVLDLHCDTASELIDRQGNIVRRLYKNPGHVDLERGRKLKRYAQLFAFFTTPGMSGPGGIPVEKLFDAMLHNLLRELEENSAFIRQAKSAAEAEAITASGKIAAFLSLEGPAGIGFDPGRLEELAALGFRVSTLTWNEQNPLAGSHRTGGGLTAQGREYVRQAQKHGIVIDVSHLSDEAFWDIMDITEGPIVASHSNSRAVWGVSRNLTDDQFKAICQSGGVVGLNLYTYFLGKDPVTLDTVCDHALHWLDLGGEKHMALGGDLDGCESLSGGFTGVECYPLLAEAMAKRGIPEKTIEDIFWNNALAVLK